MRPVGLSPTFTDATDTSSPCSNKPLIIPNRMPRSVCIGVSPRNCRNATCRVRADTWQASHKSPRESGLMYELSMNETAKSTYDANDRDVTCSSCAPCISAIREDTKLIIAVLVELADVSCQDRVFACFSHSKCSAAPSRNLSLPSIASNNLVGWISSCVSFATSLRSCLHDRLIIQPHVSSELMELFCTSPGREIKLSFPGVVL